MRAAFALLVALGSSLGCSAPPGAAPTPPTSTAPAASSAPAAAMIAPSAAPPTDDCAAPVGCRLFDTPADAFRAILATKPLVVAVGEAHAQKGTEAIPSSAKRFTGELLPLLEGRASDLLVELMAPPAGCKKTTEVVATRQKIVTEKQTDSAQSEYVIMGNEAKKHGLVPDLLRPSCADIDAIDKAGDDAIGASLGTIARLTKTKVTELLDRNAKAGADRADRIVATYGGAMHNDLTPPPERAQWSFGPDLAAHARGRYVEVDLFVPEFILETETWKKLEWYPHFNRAAHPDKTTLFNPHPGSYVLIFPRTAR